MPTLEQVRQALEAELPPVTLLLGPRRDALYGLAAQVVTAHRVHAADLLECIGSLTATDARSLVAYADIAPFGPFKAVIVNLDGASEQAQNILLKVLEEPPPSIRFILFATRPPLVTLSSRAQVFRLGLHHRSPEPAAEHQAKAAAVVRAAMSGDAAQFCSAFRDWDDVCTCGTPSVTHRKGEHYLFALRLWATSQAGHGRPGLFTHEVIEPEVLTREARRVLQLLGEYPKARPVNAAFHALYRVFLEGSSG